MKARTILIALAVFGVFSQAGGAVTYNITDLGVLPGADGSEGLAVNELGCVAGWSSAQLEPEEGWNHPFLWTPGGAMQDLGTLGGAGGMAYGINDSNQVVGGAGDPSGWGRAFLWNAGVMTDLGTLGGPSATAYGINNSGQIAGQADNASGWWHAFLWDGGVMTDLGTLGGSYSAARAVNDRAEVVGYGLMGSFERAFYWSAETGMLDIGTLGGYASYAFAVNNTGYVAGTAQLSSLAYQAFIREPSGWKQGLGTLGGDNDYSCAYGINDAGDVVGLAVDASGRQRAFFWQAGIMVDLNTLLAAGSTWDLWGAYDINNAGQIVGYGGIDGQTHAFLLDPVSAVPAPGALLLGMFGVAAVGVMRRSRAM